MAKTSSINKNEQRKALVAKYASRRKAIKAIIHSPATSPEERTEAQMQLAKLPRDSNPVRVILRCMVTGRSRGNLKKFGLSRIQLRDKALKGEITGVVKASW